MTSTTPPAPAITPGFVVLDAGLPDRPPLGHTAGYDAALQLLAAVQEQFYDQLDANDEGGHTAQLALSLSPVDVTGTTGPACYWVTVNGMRPAQR